MMLKIRLFFFKLCNWEFWNANFVYSIPSLYFLYLAFKAKSFGFFNASNPSIKNGGFAMERKMDIYDIIPKKYYPKSFFFEANQNIKTIHATLIDNKLNLPIIIKPNIGLQGMKVEKIASLVELDTYLSSVNFDFIIQEYIDFKNEIGIFYCKNPADEAGIITGIVFKEYPTIVGDGKSTINDLIIKDLRLCIHLKFFQTIYSSKLNLVLNYGEILNLITIGNHARGCKFLDISDMITPKLIVSINKICNKIPNFYYGRIDIKYNIFEELENCENFSIIEINGAASLPTHIYDPKHSLFFAWKEIIKHFNKMYEISKINYSMGVPYLTFKEVISLFSAHSNHISLLKNKTTMSL